MFNRRMKTTEERIGELEGGSTEMIIEEQRLRKRRPLGRRGQQHRPYLCVTADRLVHKKQLSK